MSEGPDEARRRAIAALPETVECEVLAALELDEAARDRALADLLAAHPAHADAVRHWLLSAGVALAANGVACPPDAADDDETCEPPRRIGPYRLVRVLGRGGFGTVWLAEQQAPAAPRVALKILNPGMDSREILRRFAAEREALHRMDHPGIARLLDAGETRAGRPFFVLEYVPGDNLLVHCRKHDLSVSQRIDLFLQVLDAVAHAHQKGVLHRDLSSNNVLVTEVDGRPQPKIIDFGVAKSLLAPLQEGGSLTFQGTLMGTPEYMSPEQARGQASAVDTRTDVYSLGVQLYELLTDQLPIPGVVLRAQGIAGMAHAIATHIPARPSHIAPRARQPELRGDLDWIALKALAKDRDERYAAATEFAADLRRHRAHQPVLAGPPSTWYLLRKFARRNRATVAGAVALLLGLIMALLVAVTSWLQASEARAELQRLHDQLRQKADTGFRLLANEDRLLAAEASAAALDPPWPDRVPAMTAWLHDNDAPMLAELQKLRDKRDELAAQRAREGGRLRDDADGYLLTALQRLQKDLERFTGPDGTVARVRERMRWAHDVAGRALTEHAQDWARAAQQVKQRHGYELRPQPGLVPLGPDPRTQLQEFLDLASHGAEEPLPVRDETGELQLRPHCGIVFVLVPAGTLRIGAQRDSGLPQRDPQAADDELGGDPVMLSEFFVAMTEVTRAQWRALGGDDQGGDPRLPATAIDWFTAGALLRRWGMALPTEAQWEYACRAGTSTPWWKGTTFADADLVGNFGDALQRVALLPANAFGLYDVHGNAAEWCADQKLAYAQCKARAGDGLRTATPPVVAEARVVRGGSAVDGPKEARCSARGEQLPQTRSAMIGVRPVRAVIRG